MREVIARGDLFRGRRFTSLSQSAVSQQIAVLEREVGIPLLERTSDGPADLRAGEALMEHGDAVVCAASRKLSASSPQIAGLEGGSSGCRASRRRAPP